jgi:hypothetical protein
MYYHSSRNMLIIGPDDRMARYVSDDEDDDGISEGMDTPPSTVEEFGECEVRRLLGFTLIRYGRMGF